MYSNTPNVLIKEMLLQCSTGNLALISSSWSPLWLGFWSSGGLRVLQSITATDSLDAGGESWWVMRLAKENGQKRTKGTWTTTPTMLHGIISKWKPFIFKVRAAWITKLSKNTVWQGETMTWLTLGNRIGWLQACDNLWMKKCWKLEHFCYIYIIPSLSTHNKT